MTKKLTEVHKDGLGVSAMIAGAGKVNDVLGERRLSLAAVDDTIVVYSPREALGGGPFLAVTVEANPRVVVVEDTDADDDVDAVRFPGRSGVRHLGNAEGHLFEGVCRCFAACCQGAPDVCICLECEGELHRHG